jgi:hypothetical protein
LLPEHEKHADSPPVNPQANISDKFPNALRIAHPGERCRTLFPEFLLACVPREGLLSLGERAGAHGSQAPALVAWLEALISEELSRRQETPWRGLPKVAVPPLPNDQSGPSAQVLHELYLHFDARPQGNASDAAAIADLLAALTSLASYSSPNDGGSRHYTGGRP